MIRLEIIEGPEYTRDDDGWEHNAYTIRLVRGGSFLTLPWKQGLGITDDPDPVSVLENLLLDANGLEVGSFEEWAQEYGFDPDSRRAERIYNEVREQTNRLRDFLGEDYDREEWRATDAYEIAQMLMVSA